MFKVVDVDLGMSVQYLQMVPSKASMICFGIVFSLLSVAWLANMLGTLVAVVIVFVCYVLLVEECLQGILSMD